MNRFRRTAWIGICLFFLPLVWQSLHRIAHINHNHCNGHCDISQTSANELHFSINTHCAVCDYELVLPGINNLTPYLNKPATLVFQYPFISEYLPAGSPKLHASTRAPPALCF